MSGFTIAKSMDGIVWEHAPPPPIQMRYIHTYHTFVILYAAGVIIAHTARRLPFQLPLVCDELVDRGVVPHARTVLCAQMY